MTVLLAVCHAPENFLWIENSLFLKAVDVDGPVRVVLNTEAPSLIFFLKVNRIF
jgi:hypothetical protein